MRSIDERIVDMQFNNRQFEEGIQTSVRSLDNLKKSLDETGNNNSLTALRTGVENISSKFSALGIMGVTALQNITTAAMDAGVALIRSLTVEPVMAGLNEYETKMNAITTILTNTQSKGTTLDDVNQALLELNEYADLTIYNFAEMTRNVGTFTAAGVDLETSVGSIKGIANLAAGSGSTPQQAANAMYQLSQALAEGRMSLQSWNSVVNAGMGGELFQHALIDKAVEFGELMPEVAEKIKSGEIAYREAISAVGSGGPLLNINTDMMVSVFNDFAEDETLVKAATQVKTFTQLVDTMQEAVQSGWAISWEHIIGDREQAIEVLTNISDAFNALIQPSMDARNEMLKFWNENGGRDAIIEAMTNAFRGLMQIIDPIIDAFKEISPPMTGERLVVLSEGLRDLSEKFKIGDETADKLRRTFEGLFALVDLIGQGFSAVFGIFGDALSYILPVSDGILDFTAKIGDFLIALRESAIEGDVFNKGIEGIKSFIFSIIDDIQSAISILREIEVLQEVKDIIDFFAEGIKESIIKIGNYFSQFSGFDLGPLRVFSDEVEAQFRPFTFLEESISEAISKIHDGLEWFAPYLSSFGQNIGNAFDKIGEVVGVALERMGFENLLDLINMLLTGGILLGLKQFVDSLADIGDSATDLLEGVTGVLDGVRGSLEAYQSQLQSKALINIAIAIGILAASLFVLSTIPAEEMKTAIAGMTVLFIELAAVMLVLSKNMGPIKLGAISVQMVAMATAILILSTAMKSLAELDWDELARGGVAIATLSSILVVTSDALGKSSAKMISGGLGLIAMSTAILILAESVQELSNLSWEELMKGLTGVGVLMLELAVFMQLMGDGAGIMKIGLAMIPLATGLLILSEAVVNMADLSWNELAKGLIGLGGALAAIATASKLIDSNSLLAMGAAMIGIGAGINLIATAMNTVGNLSWNEVAKGLIGLGGALASIVSVSQIVNPAQLIAMGVALSGIGIGLNTIALAMISFGTMSWDEIARSLIVLAGSLTILAVAMNVMQSGIAGAAALTVMSTALALLVPSLVILGSMDLENIGLMLLALVGTFAIFGVAGMALGPLVPIMLGLSGAIALLGVGVLALGTGLLALSTAMIGVAAGGASFVASLTFVVISLIELIPKAITSLAEGIISFLAVIADGIPTIMIAITAIVEGIIQILVDLAPDLVNAVFVFMGEMLKVLVEYVPIIVDAGMNILLGFIKGIADNIQEVIDTALHLISEFLLGIATGVPGIIKAAVQLIAEFIIALGVELPKLIDAGYKMIIEFINGLSNCIRENASELGKASMNLAAAIIEGIVTGLLGGVVAVRDSIVEVGKSIWQAFKDFWGIRSPSRLMKDGANDIIAGLLIGFSDGLGSLGNKARELGTKIFDELERSVSNVSSIATNVVDTLGDGLKNGISTVSNAARNLGVNILDGIKDALDINSPAKTMIEVAFNIGKGLIVGLKEMTKPVEETSKELGKDTGKGLIVGLKEMEKPIEKVSKELGKDSGKGLMNGLKDMNKSIKDKVIDLGKDTGKSLVVGLKKMVDPVKDVSNELGEEAIDGMKYSLKKVSDVVYSDMDLEPVIRPVVDLSEVKKSLESLKTMFSKGYTINVSGIKEQASRISSLNLQNGSELSKKPAMVTENKSNVNITNNYSVRKDDDIRKINNKLNSSIERYAKAKGVPVKT